jgi:hypothetical protein
LGGLIARASLSTALHQAAGGWRPAPLHSWRKEPRPCQESPRRDPDRWWPLQTSETLPLVPLDISYPAQSGSPLLRATVSRTRCDYALRRNPFRRKVYKSELKAAAVDRAALDARRRSRIRCEQGRAPVAASLRRPHSSISRSFFSSSVIFSLRFLWNA